MSPRRMIGRALLWFIEPEQRRHGRIDIHALHTAFFDEDERRRREESDCLHRATRALAKELGYEDLDDPICRERLFRSIDENTLRRTQRLASERGPRR